MVLEYRFATTKPKKYEGASPTLARYGKMLRQMPLAERLVADAKIAKELGHVKAPEKLQKTAEEFAERQIFEDTLGEHLATVRVAREYGLKVKLHETCIELLRKTAMRGMANIAGIAMGLGVTFMGGVLGLAAGGTLEAPFHLATGTAFGPIAQLGAVMGLMLGAVYSAKVAEFLVERLKE